MTVYITELATLMAIFAFVIVSPGADLAMVMRQSLVHGRKAAVATSVGIGVSLLFHIGYTILGLGLVISQSIALFNLIKWAGVVYLLYIGFKSLRAGASPIAEADPATATETARQSLVRAFALGFASQCPESQAAILFPFGLRQRGRRHDAARRQIRLWARYGRLPDPLVRGRQLLHDDTAHAGRLRARQPMDRSDERCRVHRARPQTRDGKDRLIAPAARRARPKATQVPQPPVKAVI